MKLVPLLMLGVLTVGSLAACGPDREEAFLDAIRERVPESAEMSDEQLLGTARNTCRQLEEGKTLEEIRNQSFENYMGGELDSDAVNRIVSGGETAAQEYCPEAVGSK